MAAHLQAKVDVGIIKDLLKVHLLVFMQVLYKVLAFREDAVSFEEGVSSSRPGSQITGAKQMSLVCK